MGRTTAKTRGAGGRPVLIGRAFGLEVRSEETIEGLTEPDTAVSESLPRTVQVVIDEGVGKTPERYPLRTFTMQNRHQEDLFTINHGPTIGYRVWIDGLGCCELSLDGCRIDYLSTPEAVDAGMSWRLLFAQALPICAALQGLEPLHASAVAFGDEALVITGESGAGKTSAALHLLRRGATFLADDVVALDVLGEHVLAYPGLLASNVSATEDPVLDELGIRPRQGGAGDKNIVVLPRRSAAARLTDIFFLERSGDISHPVVTLIERPDPRRLLAATFVGHVPGPVRALRQLDICARVAETARLYEVVAPVRGNPAEVADAILEHAAPCR